MMHLLGSWANPLKSFVALPGDPRLLVGARARGAGGKRQTAYLPVKSYDSFLAKSPDISE